jgi:hypothetical protein
LAKRFPPSTPSEILILFHLNLTQNFNLPVNIPPSYFLARVPPFFLPGHIIPSAKDTFLFPMRPTGDLKNVSFATRHLARPHVLGTPRLAYVVLRRFAMPETEYTFLLPARTLLCTCRNIFLLLAWIRSSFLSGHIPPSYKDTSFYLPEHIPAFSLDTFCLPIRTFPRSCQNAFFLLARRLLSACLDIFLFSDKDMFLFLTRTHSSFLPGHFHSSCRGTPFCLTVQTPSSFFSVSATSTLTGYHYLFPPAPFPS